MTVDLPEPSIAAQTANEKVVSQPSPPGPGPLVPGTGSLEKDRLRIQSSLDAVQRQRVSAVEGLQKLDQQIERATIATGAADSTKLTSLHAKRRTFEQRLEELASQEEILTRHLGTIAQKERVSTVELHLTARRNAHHEGVAMADKLRSALAVVEGLYQSWKEWSEIERRLKDTLRSLAPDRMTELPEFSYATAIDQAFQTALGQVISESRRSESALRTREESRHA